MKAYILGTLKRAIDDVSKALAEHPSTDLSFALSGLLDKYTAFKEAPTQNEVTRIQSKLASYEKRLETVEQWQRKIIDNREPRGSLATRLGR